MHHRQTPVLAIYDVALRRLKKSDKAAVVRLCRHRAVNRFLSMPISSGARFDQYYKWMRAKQRAGACVSFVVTRHHDTVGLMQVRLTHPGVGELGWVVSPDVWGSHVFTTAASLLCGYAYDAMGLSRLEARIAVQNTRAARAVAKLGAVREAVLRQSLRIAGRTFDEQLWALVKVAPRRSRVMLLVSNRRPGFHGASPHGSSSRESRELSTTHPMRVCA